MDNEQCTINNEMEFTEAETCELQAEIESLRSRVDMLTRDNAELISDNLALRAKTEALLQARAALPEFAVTTELIHDKYANVREAFKKANKK
jgi:chromosome segregation ATPase